MFRFKNLIAKILKIFKYKITKIKEYKFIGLYNDYEEALKNSKYQNYIPKTFDKSSKLKELDDIEVDGRFLVWTTFFSTKFSDKSLGDLKFIEVGGGSNPLYLYTLKSTKKKINFQILEEENFQITLPKEHSGYLKYITKLNDIDFNNSKAIIFSGSIQYMKNYLEVLSKAFKEKIDYIIILETFFTNRDKNYVTLQNNMGNFKFPNIFFSSENFNNNFFQNNYQLILKTNRKKDYTHNILSKDDFFIQDLIFKLM